MAPRWTRREFASTLAALGLGFALPGFPQAGKAAPFNLGIITDEVGPDLEQALRFIVSSSIPCGELRTLGQKNIVTLALGEMHHARQLIRKHGVKVAAIDSPLFKYDLPEMPAPLPPQKRDLFGADYTDKDTGDLLQRCFNLARFFGTSKIRVFSYFRVAQPEKAYPLVRERLAKAAALAARHNLILLLENEMVCNIATSKELGASCATSIRRTCAVTGIPLTPPCWAKFLTPLAIAKFADCLPTCTSRISARILKRGQAIWACVGDGLIDYRGLLKALQRDRYEGVLSLETHYRRPDGNALESSRASLEGLRKIISEVA